MWLQILAMEMVRVIMLLEPVFVLLAGMNLLAVLLVLLIITVLLVPHVC